MQKTVECRQMCGNMHANAAFDAIYQASNNVIFRLVSCANYCAQRNPQDDVEDGTNRSMRASDISKVSCAQNKGRFAKCVLYMNVDVAIGSLN